MPDFESLLKVIVEGLAMVFIPIGAYAAFRATRLIGKRGMSEGATQAELEQLRSRLDELERRGETTGELMMHERRIAELEERIDFAERLLAQRHDAPQLPLHRTPV